MSSELRKQGFRRGGFTLVEVLVVLLILAILAATVIPSFSGYTDKAASSAILTETRMAVMTATTLLSESYSFDRDIPSTESIVETALLPGEIILFETDKDRGLLKHLIYSSGERYCTYCGLQEEGCTINCDAEYVVSEREPLQYVQRMQAALASLTVNNLGGNNNQTLYQYFSGRANGTGIDSNTPNGTNFPKVKTALAAAGFDTYSGSWALIRSDLGSSQYNYLVYYTPVDIDMLKLKDTVAVTVYNPATGRYYSTKVGLKSNTLKENGVSCTYNVMVGINGKSLANLSTAQEIPGPDGKYGRDETAD